MSLMKVALYALRLKNMQSGSSSEPQIPVVLKARQGRDMYIKNHFSISLPSQCWTQAVVSVNEAGTSWAMINQGKKLMSKLSMCPNS